MPKVIQHLDFVSVLQGILVKNVNWKPHVMNRNIHVMELEFVIKFRVSADATMAGLASCVMYTIFAMKKVVLA